VGIYSYEDRFTQHRYKADQAFELSTDKSPVAAYLDIPTIVDLCVQNGVQAVHPGYGLLSENASFAKALEDSGVKFVGPTVDNLNTFGKFSQLIRLFSFVHVFFTHTMVHGFLCRG
jgi:pyruvate carboxylase